MREFYIFTGASIAPGYGIICKYRSYVSDQKVVILKRKVFVSGFGNLFSGV